MKMIADSMDGKILTKQPKNSPNFYKQWDEFGPFEKYLFETIDYLVVKCYNISRTVSKVIIL